MWYELIEELRPAQQPELFHYSKVNKKWLPVRYIKLFGGGSTIR